MGPDPRLRPTPALPGIRISAPVHAERPFGSVQPAAPFAEYVCRCGATDTAHGAEAVAALVAWWDDHQPQCPGRTERPCQHCGKPTRARSSGMSGWPAHPECYAAWAERPVEQRRRAHQADRIKARETQRWKTARLRDRLAKDGYAPDVIDLIISGSWSNDQESAT
ncbi:hypothetical protein [Streptomyces sp. NPDC008139]|uniref:hypothetical protein n=1 Tax=Streptomyces sp. NPDC008139 TaxID=3364814 RepID=UPI0036E44C62